MKGKNDPHTSHSDTSCTSLRDVKVKGRIPDERFWLFASGSWPVAPFRGCRTCIHDPKNHPHIDVSSMSQLCPWHRLVHSPACDGPSGNPGSTPGPCLPGCWSAWAQLPVGAASFLSSPSWAAHSVTPCPLAAFFVSSLGNLDLACWADLKPLPFLRPASSSVPLPAPDTR